MGKNQAHGDRMPSLIASALEDYKNRQWYAFGTQLGAAMQELVVTTFPQKYEVDNLGTLKRILGAAEFGHVSNVAQPTVVLTSFFCVAFGSFILLAIFAVVRTKHSWGRFLSSESTRDFGLLPLESTDGMIVE